MHIGLPARRTNRTIGLLVSTAMFEELEHLAQVYRAGGGQVRLGQNPPAPADGCGPADRRRRSAGQVKKNGDT